MKFLDCLCLLVLGAFSATIVLFTFTSLSFKNPRVEYSQDIDLSHRDIFGCVYVPNHHQWGPKGWSYCAEPEELMNSSPALEKFLEKHRKDLELDLQ
jgi:hypothetical protein